MRWFIYILFLLPLTGLAQNSQKIGHADWEYIFSQLPEYKKIESEMLFLRIHLQFLRLYQSVNKLGLKGSHPNMI